MKKFFFCIPLLFSFLLVACQNENQQDSTVYESIARNSYFKAYLNAVRKNQQSILTESVDLKSLAPVILKFGDFCTIPPKEVSGIKGGIEYVEAQCEISKTQLLLKKNLPEYSSLSKDQLRRVIEIFNHIENNAWKEKVNKIAIDQSKN